MQTNQFFFVNRLRVTCRLVLCLVLTVLFIFTMTAAHGHSTQAMNKVKLSVEDPRPVAKMIELLEEKYGWIITYEDPRYVHESDVADVTLKVRRDLDKYKPGEAPKVIIPKGVAMEFTYDAASVTNLPIDPVAVVQSLLDAQTARSHGGRFRLEKSGKILHVMPAAIKNSEGRLVAQASMLDTVISLPAGQRTVLQKLESICAAISQATGIPFELGTVPETWFSHRQDNSGVIQQRARDALISMFATMGGGGANLSWQLFYGPGTKRYVLNIHLVSKRRV